MAVISALLHTPGIVLTSRIHRGGYLAALEHSSWSRARLFFQLLTKLGRRCSSIAKHPITMATRQRPIIPWRLGTGPHACRQRRATRPTSRASITRWRARAISHDRPARCRCPRGAARGAAQGIPRGRAACFLPRPRRTSANFAPSLPLNRGGNRRPHPSLVDALPLDPPTQDFSVRPPCAPPPSPAAAVPRRSPIDGTCGGTHDPRLRGVPASRALRPVSGAPRRPSCRRLPGRPGAA